MTRTYDPGMDETTDDEVLEAINTAITYAFGILTLRNEGIYSQEQFIEYMDKYKEEASQSITQHFAKKLELAELKARSNELLNQDVRNTYGIGVEERIKQLNLLIAEKEKEL